MHCLSNVALGAIALRTTSPRRTALALVAAIAVLTYIVAVATNRFPFPFESPFA